MEEEEDVDATGRFILPGCFRPSNEEIERRGMEGKNTRWKDSRESDIMETLREKRGVTWGNDSGLLVRLYRSTTILRPESSRGSWKPQVMTERETTVVRNKWSYLGCIESDQSADARANFLLSFFRLDNILGFFRYCHLLLRMTQEEDTVSLRVISYYVQHEDTAMTIRNCR